MEDTAWPHEGMLEEYLEAARTNYAPEPGRRRPHGRSLLELQAVFRPALGGRAPARGRAVAAGHPAQAIRRLVTSEVPPEYRAPGTWMHDALDVRDDWESRLLRTTAWSPLY